MTTKRKKFFITTSIAYTNAPPHIGFALEAVQADVLARYHQSLNEEVFFLTGTDEHGRKVAVAAEEEGKDPKEFVDEISKKFKALKQVLNLSNDDFLRTTDRKRHWPAVKKLWLTIKEKGDIYKKKYTGLYCIGCESFITKKDLIDGKCIYHQKKPEVIKEENYFFRLSKYQNQIEEAIKNNRIQIIPESRKNEMWTFIKEGLNDVSFSRPRKDLKWGIPVPNDDTQTVYVWADALTNYLSGIGFSSDSKAQSQRFKNFWPADIHCIGKDIAKFHCLIWPGMLLSAGLPLPKKIFIHGYITVGGQKMSKSLGNVIDPFELVKKYGTDPVRYFLLREIPPAEDGDFTYEKFEKRYNGDLARGLGNLVARVITLAAKAKSQKPKIKTTSQNSKIRKIIDETWRKYRKALDEFKFNEALIATWNLISFCDEQIEKERLWEKKEGQKEVISDLLLVINEIAELLRPFLPETSEKILKQLKTKKAKPLFPRIK